ncbi:hypothetical protein Tco_0483521 [Tanacetum coccineum]
MEVSQVRWEIGHTKIHSYQEAIKANPGRFPVRNAPDGEQKEYYRMPEYHLSHSPRIPSLKLLNERSTDANEVQPLRKEGEIDDCPSSNTWKNE